MPRTLTLADGQLAAQAATILAGADAPEGRLNIIVHNTGTIAQTVVLTFRRAGGTARRVARAELGPDEQLFVTGLPIQPDDTLLGVASTASAVDYLVVAGGVDELWVRVVAADGSERLLDTAETSNQTVNGQVSAAVHDDTLRRGLEELIEAIKSLPGHER